MPGIGRGGFRPSRLRLPNDPSVLAYIAGLMDGEGCITREHGNWKIQIGMTDASIIKWLGRFGGTVRREKHQNPRWNDCWRWRVMAQAEVAEFLNALVPYLRVKRDLAVTTIHEIIIRRTMGQRGLRAFR